MRLTSYEHVAIKKILLENFGQDAKIMLFGSRTDDSKKGGDIDLYVETKIADINEIYDKKSSAVIELYDKIGEQKIDLIVHRNGDDFTPIEKIALETGTLL